MGSGQEAYELRKMEMEPQRKEEKFNAVTKPSHYASGSIECIEAIAVAVQALVGIEATLTSNAIKYCWRWKEKNGVEDLRKAARNIEMLINHLEGRRMV